MIPCLNHSYYNQRNDLERNKESVKRRYELIDVGGTLREIILTIVKRNY